MKNVIELLEAKGFSPKKASTTKGGEYHSACPGCGGDDRFHVWPAQNEGKGSYWCRQCGKGGDNIQFLIDFDGVSFVEACRSLDVDLPEKQPFRTPRVKQICGEGPGGWQPVAAAEPETLWREKASKLVTWANENLLENKGRMRWLLERGILKKMVERHRLGWVPENMWRPRASWGLADEVKKDGKKKKLWIPQGLVIPLMAGDTVMRIRIRRPEGEPRYYAMPGSNMDCMITGAGSRLAVVIESELDAILLERFVEDMARIIALGNSSRKPDAAAAEILRAANLILLSVDFDAGGINQVPWWERHFERVKYWPVPEAKDPGDAYKAGVDLRAWVTAGCPRGWFIEASLLGAHPGPVKKADPPAPEKEAKEPIELTAEIPSGVRRLYELLKGTPVFILNSENRTSLHAPRSWSDRHWELEKEISQLVYFDPPVFEYICSHPHERIGADNLIINKSG